MTAGHDKSTKVQCIFLDESSEKYCVYLQGILICMLCMRSM
jgi:hypothetical protein